MMLICQTNNKQNRFIISESISETNIHNIVKRILSADTNKSVEYVYVIPDNLFEHIRYYNVSGNEYADTDYMSLDTDIKLLVNQMLKSTGKQNSISVFNELKSYMNSDTKYVPILESLLYKYDMQKSKDICFFKSPYLHNTKTNNVIISTVKYWIENAYPVILILQDSNNRILDIYDFDDNLDTEYYEHLVSQNNLELMDILDNTAYIVGISRIDLIAKEKKQKSFGISEQFALQLKKENRLKLYYQNQYLKILDQEFISLPTINDSPTVIVDWLFTTFHSMNQYFVDKKLNYKFESLSVKIEDFDYDIQRNKYFLDIKVPYTCYDMNNRLLIDKYSTIYTNTKSLSGIDKQTALYCTLLKSLFNYGLAFQNLFISKDVNLILVNTINNGIDESLISRYPNINKYSNFIIRK